MEPKTYDFRLAIGSQIFHALRHSKNGMAFLACLAFPCGAWSFSCMGGAAVRFTIPSSIPAENIGNLPVHGVIFSQTSFFTNAFFYNCQTQDRDNSYSVAPAEPLVKGDIYQSSDPRVGLRMSWAGKRLPFSNAFSGVTYPGARLGLQERYSPMTVELIKLADIDSQVRLRREFANIIVGKEIIQQIAFSNSVVIDPPARPTCSPSTDLLSVTLAPTRVTDFKGVGSTSAEKSFAITLDCSHAGAAVMVRMTLSDAVEPGNTSDRLMLTRDSTARGVGVQVLRNGQPLRFGANAPGNPWSAGQLQGSSAQALRIPLAARYVQTDNIVQAGDKAQARARFTIEYQ